MCGERHHNQLKSADHSNTDRYKRLKNVNRYYCFQKQQKLNYRMLSTHTRNML